MNTIGIKVHISHFSFEVNIILIYIYIDFGIMLVDDTFDDSKSQCSSTNSYLTTILEKIITKEI